MTSRRSFKKRRMAREVAKRLQKRLITISFSRFAAQGTTSYARLRGQFMFCTKCGTKNPENSANCYNCGQKIAAAYESSQLRSDNEVISPTNVDTRKLAQGLQDQSDSLKTPEW